MHIFNFNVSSTGNREYEEFMLMGAPQEFLDILLARQSAASHIVLDEQGNHQLDGIGYYEFLAMGGNPDDLAPVLPIPPQNDAALDYIANI